MKRILLACTIAASCVGVGCNTASNTNNTSNANKPVASASTTPTTNTSASPAVATSPSPAATPVGKSNSPDISGAYFPVGTLQSDFSEIEHLYIGFLDDNGNAAPLNGFLRPKRRQAKDYKILNPKLDGNDLTFTTESVNGVSYKFKGKFVTMDNFAENPPPTDRVILKGELQKFQDGGAPIAGTDVSFTYSAGG